LIQFNNLWAPHCMLMFGFGAVLSLCVCVCVCVCVSVRTIGRSVMRDSKYNSEVIARLLPNPKLFRLVWKLTKGSEPLYVWEAVSPDPRFTALSMVATKSESAPPLDVICCVPISWCVPAPEPRRVFQEGTGALWSVGSLGFLAAAKGPMPPAGTWYDLRPDLAEREFKLLEADQLLMSQIFKLV
jgi:hypothetical protein